MQKITVKMMVTEREYFIPECAQSIFKCLEYPFDLAFFKSLKITVPNKGSCTICTPASL